jgi:hypothetical protein
MTNTIKINVGGQIFETYECTLRKINYFNYLLDDTNIDLTTTIPFIDRPAHVFKHVLALAMDPNYKYPIKYKSELDFYDMSPVINELQCDDPKYNVFFDELKTCFEKLSFCNFMYLPVEKQYCPILKKKKYGTYEKNRAQVTDIIKNIGQLIENNSKYLDKICIMFNPVLITEIFKPVYYGRDKEMIQIGNFNSTIYELYYVTSMQLIDISEYNMNYGQNFINLNNYIIDKSQIYTSNISDNVAINLGSRKFYVKYLVPINVIIPLPCHTNGNECLNMNPRYDPSIVFSNIKFVDMLGLRDDVNKLNGYV